MKEKDLKNHLEGATQDRKTKQKKSPSSEEKQKEMNKRRLDFKIGAVTAENLQSDNQIMRALEILIGYDIFEKTNG